MSKLNILELNDDDIAMQPPGAVIRALLAEVRRLRADVDRLTAPSKAINEGLEELFGDKAKK